MKMINLAKEKIKMQNKNSEMYRVSRSVNPTRHTNAKRIWVSSGPVSLYKLFNLRKFINVSGWKMEGEE